MNFKKLFTTISLLALLTSCESSQESQRQHDIDHNITTNIVDQLKADRTLRPYAIQVETVGGNVELSGSVDTHAEAAKAADAALRVSGVRSVRNDLHVRNLVSEPKPRGDSVKREAIDTALTAAVKLALLNDGSVTSSNVNVSTRNAVVYLTGTIPTHAEASQAARIALKVKGVRQVDNQIVVE